MSTPQPCPHTEQAVAWALHALEPDEEEAFRRHLPGCADCRATEAETEEILAALGGAVPVDEPPPRLRDRILDEAARTPQVPQARLAARESRGPGGGAGNGPSRGVPPRRRAARRGRPRLRARRVAALATAAVVAVAAIVGLSGYAAALKSERDSEAARAQGMVTLVRQLATPGTAHAFLASSAGGAAVAAVVVTRTQQTVMPVGLPANARDHVYVLWGLPGGGTPTPLGTFDVRDGGPGVQSVGSSPDGAGFAQFAISLEPGRAAPASPSDVVASGRAEI